MKAIIFLITIYTSLTQAALWKGDQKIGCIGNRGKVSVLFEMNSQTVRLIYNNQEGQKDFPIYDGAVTTQTLPFIDFAKTDLQEVDQRLVLEWPAGQCHQSDDDAMLIGCDGEAKNIYPENLSIKSYTFFTTKIAESSATQTYEMFKVRLGLDSENMHHHIGMQFNPQECFISSVKKSARKHPLK